MTVAETAVRIAAVLRAWAEPRGGRVEILPTQAALWQTLTDVPDLSNLAPRIVLLWTNESLLYPSTPDCYRVERRWQAIVIRGRGFRSVVQRDPLSGEQFEPFTDSVESVRDLIRSITDVSEYEFFPSVLYYSTKPFPLFPNSPSTAAFTDAFAVEFATINDIPKITLNATEVQL